MGVSSSLHVASKHDADIVGDIPDAGAFEELIRPICDKVRIYYKICVASLALKIYLRSSSH